MYGFRAVCDWGSGMRVDEPPGAGAAHGATSRIPAITGDSGDDHDGRARERSRGRHQRDPGLAPRGVVGMDSWRAVLRGANLSRPRMNLSAGRLLPPGWRQN